jgi:hypothetical protein
MEGALSVAQDQGDFPLPLSAGERGRDERIKKPQFIRPEQGRVCCRAKILATRSNWFGALLFPIANCGVIQNKSGLAKSGDDLHLIQKTDYKATGISLMSE